MAGPPSLRLSPVPGSMLTSCPWPVVAISWSCAPGGCDADQRTVKHLVEALPVLGAQETTGGGVIRVEHVAGGLEDVEVRLALESERLPGLAGVGGLDQPQVSGQILTEVRVAAVEEVARADDGERHRVLIPVGDAARPAALVDVAEAEAGGDVEAVVGRIDAETMDVTDARVLIGGRRCRRGVLGAAAREESGAEEDGCEGDVGSVHDGGSEVRIGAEQAE